MCNAVTKMNKDVKELFNDPRVLYSVAAIISILLIAGCADIYTYYSEEQPADFDNIVIDGFPQNNNKYIGLVKLGLALSSEMRTPQEKDIDTGIKLRSGDKTYSLIESRTWKTLDYGDTFLTQIE